MHDNKGFTLMELIIVLALMTVIGAIAVVAYPKTMERSKLKSDIQSVRVMQSAVDLYYMDGNATMTIAGTDTIATVLFAAGYLKTAITPQTANGASWNYTASTKTVKLDLSNVTDTSLREAINKLDAEDRKLVTGFAFTS